MKKIEYLIKVVYKSGYAHEFWCSNFELEKSNGKISATWTSVESSNRPLYLGIDDVSSIWEQGERIVEFKDGN